MGGAVYYAKLHEMPHCDFVVLACPLSDATRKLIGADEFKLMKKTSTIVNIARGELYSCDFVYQVIFHIISA